MRLDSSAANDISYDDDTGLEQVCSFHQSLNEAIPDLQISLDHIWNDKTRPAPFSWRASCRGTQMREFIPGLPVGTQATFSLQVSVGKDSKLDLLLDSTLDTLDSTQAG